MEKIAIISDIHSNLEALKTVFKDIENRGITRIFCLGDIIAKGVHSHECLSLIREKCEVILQGNCDDFFSKHFLENQMSERIIFNQGLLSQEELNFLSKLPFSYDFYLSGALVRLVHATPWANNQFVGASSSQEEEWQMFLPTHKTESEIADMVIFGHIHTPYVNKAFHHILINTGSVGNAVDVFQDESHPGKPQLTTKASYLILEGNFQDKNDGPMSYMHVFLPYDIQKELSSPRYNPEKEAYVTELQKGTYRDLAKLHLKRK